MKIATKPALLFVAVAILSLPLSVARAQLAAGPVPARGPDATLTLDNVALSKVQGKSATNALTTIYDNTSSGVTSGISSTDLTSKWGDELFTIGMGLLSTHKFTIYNNSTNAGSLTSATVSVSFFNAVTSASLGGYAGTVPFSPALAPGTYSIITASSLDGLLINLNTTDLVVIQTLTATTGAANRLGVVLPEPIVVGSSPATMYVQSATIGGGVPGFYNFGVPTDVGNFIAVNPPPVSTQSKTWGTLKKLYH